MAQIKGAMEVKRGSGLEARFWAKVDQAGDCWLWTASTDKYGYGRIGLGRRDAPTDRAHRVSWRLHYGEIPRGQCVLHECDNPLCVRPTHLFLGTRTTNSEDKVSKGRARGPKGVTNPNAKLTAAVARLILKNVQAGMTMVNAARAYGVTPPTVRDIVRGVTWNDATGLPRARR